MASMTTESLVRQIGSLFDGTSVAAMSDRQLLDRFAARRDAAGEAAFAAVVRRHGPMVLGVCNDFLHDSHDAEDAVQAVFLVLARKAHSIRDLDLLGNWLYGVTIRTCRHLRHQCVRRRKNEATMPVVNAASSIAASSAEQACSDLRTGRVAARRDRAIATCVPTPRRALLPRRPHRSRDRPAPRLLSRHDPQPDGPRARQAQAWPYPPRCRLARGHSGHRTCITHRLRVRAIPLVRNDRSPRD